jgi:ParB/RepB/Spo0J family partition protein
LSILTVGSTSVVKEIDIESIVPSNLLNFRLKAEDPSDLESLVLSIHKYGLIYPLLVREMDYGSSSTTGNRNYQLVSGYRRYLACKKLRLKSVLCKIVLLNDRSAYEVALVDNLQRQTLNPIEEAEAFKTYLTTFGKGTISELALKIGKSEEYVSHRLLLLKLPNAIMKKVSRRLLKSGEATELLWLSDSHKQMELADEIAQRKLSFRQTRRIIKLLKSSPSLTVRQAVEQITTTILQARSSSTDQEDNLDTTPAWMSYKTDKRPKDADLLDHAMLVLRSCLAGFDMLVEKAESENLRSLMLKERVEIHQVLDEVIKYSVSIK